MVQAFADHEVFTISGRVPGFESEKGTFVVADSLDQVMATFEDWGFDITSAASLADVSQSIAILEALASKDPEVGDEEYLDLLPSPGEGRRAEDQIFTFVGQTEQARRSGKYQAGFATAADQQTLTKYLRSMGFEPYSAMSYTEVQALHDAMRKIALDQDFDEAHLVNLKN